ncbi:M15 family metallopeptidase [Sphingomonas profundi]|uniref:M15 family metallopeptidase n=1 Tax=Alterirhizorhabdus profundi TaxID=2681549 RepID=UPI0012E77F23|nr:M15 family metallopeptidase [Sphingomonas profundi]
MSTVFPREKDALAFYGSPGSGHVRIRPPYQLWFGDQKVSSILIHGKCADSALRAMERIAAAYSPADIHRLGFDAFAGCFNDRDKRGGTTKSMHAYACAIDWNAGRNPLRADHRTASFARPECRAFLDAWEAEGWISLGRARDYDWMHVQAARL